MKLKRTKLSKKQIWAAMLVVAIGLSMLWPVPDPLFDSPYSKMLLSREGKLLSARIAPDGQWRFPHSTKLPYKYVQSLLTFEDRHFFKHPGINPISISRAIYQNISAGKIVSGGSTITMQLARMARGNQHRNVYQKLVEIWLALRIEIKYSKSEILQLYAAHAPFGGNVVGFEAAAWRYYGRSPNQLSWAEVANLTVLPNAPGLIFPGSRDGLLLDKRNRLLHNIYEQGFLGKTELRLSLGEPIPGIPHRLPDMSRHLLDRSTKEYPELDRIESTLDYDLQESTNQIVNEYSRYFKDKQIHNSAAIIIEVESGEVLAYIGNTGVGDVGEHGQDVDIITSRRSPGSLLKPVLYALAIDEGIITPKQLLPDIPMYYQGFAPQNFNKKFHGAIQADLALRSSLNVPFVHLLKEYGYEKMHYKLGKFGVASLDKPAGHYGLTMILGGGEVTMWEMTSLYAGLARSLNRYGTSTGKLRYNSEEYIQNRYMMDTPGLNMKSNQEFGMVGAGALWHMFEAMQELRRPEALSNWQRFQSASKIAWKTGTSYGHKDAWAIGVNGKYVVGVWMGNADGEGRPDLTGVEAAAPLMFRLFEIVDDNSNFSIPIADMTELPICIQSGFRAGPNCLQTSLDLVANSIKKTTTCPFHKNLHLDKEMKWQVNSSCYPVKNMKSQSWFVLPPAQAWYYKKWNSDYENPPKLLAQCNTGDNTLMELIYPRKQTKVYVPIEIDGSAGKVVFEAAHGNPDSNIYWHLDEEFVGVTKTNHQLGLYPQSGVHKLSLLDDAGRQLVVSFEVLNK